MVEHITKNIYKIEVPLKGNPLKYLNSYFIRGDEEDFLIDTGFNTQDCEDALRAGLEEVGCRKDKLNIINTHLHMDHAGLDYLFTSEGKKAYMSKDDWESTKKFYFGAGMQREERDLKEGITLEKFHAMRGRTPSKLYREPQFNVEQMEAFEDGHVFEIGNISLKAITVPGHTIGNTMFWCEEEGLMFTGDHILFDITPNISIWMEMDDALTQYLNSLDKAKAYDVKLALPGHRNPGDYRARIDVIKEHHELRLKEVLYILEKNPGLNAYELTEKMSWRVHRDPDGSFPLKQLWFASGEAMAHLDCLVTRGLVERREGDPYFTYHLK